MKLCADILYWRLKEELTGVLFHGRKNSTLILNRPEFYLDRSQSFEENSVYVCSADHLPQTPELGENVCLVCLGEHWNLNAYYSYTWQSGHFSNIQFGAGSIQSI